MRPQTGQQERFPMPPAAVRATGPEATRAAAAAEELAAGSVEPVVLKHAPGASVVLHEPAALVFKTRRLTAAGALRLMLRLHPFDRAARGSARLARAKVPATAPVALLIGPDGRRDARGRVVSLVLPYEPGVTLLDAIHAGACDEQVAETVGSTLERIASAGLFHRDAKPSNWVLSERPGREGGCVLIDCEGVRRRGPTTGRRRALERMLASLGIEPDGAEAVASYARTVALSAAANDPALAEQLLERARARVRRHRARKHAARPAVAS